jgi:hypothetical protein
MPHPHPSSFRQATSSCAWGIGSLLLVFLGTGVPNLLSIPTNLWPLAWFFEVPAIFAAVQAIKKGYAARERATMQREHIIFTTGLVAGYLACVLAIAAASSLSLLLSHPFPWGRPFVPTQPASR